MAAGDRWSTPVTLSMIYGQPRTLGEGLSKYRLVHPPYIQMGALADLSAQINLASGALPQARLQALLSRLYEPVGIAAMVLERYPRAPVLRDYKVTISEAVEAHL